MNTKWTKINQTKFAADASDLNWDWSCPVCNETPKYEGHFDREHELTHNTAKCTCGTELTIFND